MPYTVEHKARTRARIVASARKLFNRRGFADVSIEEIMAGAGLTRGGFYNHFESKEALYVEAVSAILSCDHRPDWRGRLIERDASPSALVRQIVEAYLSDHHLADMDTSCPLVALPSDVARGGKPVKRAYRHVLEALVGLFQHGQDGQPDARARAMTMAILCVGGMVLARAVDDEGLGAEVRRVALKSALEQGLCTPQSTYMSEEGAPM